METKNKGTRLAGYVSDYVVFDLETTGISSAKDAIVEISALRVRSKKVVDRFSTLVNPMRPIPYAATAVNGITDAMVKDAPLISQAFAEFMDFAGKDVLVGHNIHSFDLKFLYRVAQEEGRTLTNDYIDTLSMARRCLPELSHHRLTDLAAHFGIATEGAHRALNDCVMNQQCFECMAKLSESVSLPVCPQCGGELIKRNGRFGAFYGCSNFPQCRYTKNA